MLTANEIARTEVAALDFSRDEELIRLRARVAELEREAGRRKEVDASLRESRDLFQAFMSNSPVLAYMKDEEDRYVYANGRLHEILGRRVNWWHKTDRELWPEPVAEQLQSNDRDALRGNCPIKRTEVLPQADGPHNWITFKFPFRTSGGRRYLAAISIDETAKTKAEAERDRLLESERLAREEAQIAQLALRDSESKARRLFQSNTVGIIEIDADRILNANDCFLRMVGYSREELEQGKLLWREMTPERHRGSDRKALEEAVASGVFAPFEKEFATKQGGTVPVLIGGTLAEKPPSWTCMFFVLDLTERRQVESRLLQAQKLESAGLLAGGVAHDLNNWLASMMGNASLAQEAVLPHHPAYRNLEDVVMASRRASELTQQLLSYAGRGKPVIRPIDVTELVGDISRLVESSMSKKIDLRLELASNLHPIEADTAQIQQVVMNLVINASEAVDENPGSVVVRTGAIQLDALADAVVLTRLQIPAGDYVFVEVKDTGCGMSQETQARIFDPFFTTKPHGHGLGLSAVLGIVRAHRGAMHVESVVGRGTTFRVLFPASVQKVATPNAAEIRKTLSGTGLILVVDDEEAVRKMAKATLERYGYEVLLAENGQQAVDVFAARPDDIRLVLMDLAMPVMNGVEAVERLGEIRPDIRIVVTSGYNESEAMQRIEVSGAAAFIQKPYTATQLAEQLKRALES